MITLISSPSSGTIPISDCVRWEFTHSDIESETYVRKMQYRLGKDGQLGKFVDFNAVEGEVFYLDFSDVIRAFMSTPPPPTSFQGSSSTMEGMKCEVFINFREITFDKETCEQTVTGNSTTPVVTVVNATSNYGNIFAEGKFLNCKPCYQEVCKDTPDWLMACGASTVDLLTTYTDGSSTTSSYTTGSGVSAIGVGPANLGQLSGTIDTISLSVGGEEIAFYKVVCCDCPVVVAFQCCAGGYDSITFEKDEGTVSSKFSEICVEANECTSGTLAEYLGTRVISSQKQSKVEHKVYKYIDYDHSSIDKWITEFATSDNHWILDPPSVFTGNAKPAYLKAGSIKVYKKDETTVVSATLVEASIKNRPVA